MISFLDTIALSDTKTVKQKNGNKMMGVQYAQKRVLLYFQHYLYLMVTWLFYAALVTQIRFF